jgi:Tfp pilus assembly PilM family ATPase
VRKALSLDQEAARAALRRGGDWLQRQLLEPDWPTTAVEVRPRSVSVVRLIREGGRLRLGAAASLDLPEGTLEVTLSRANLVDPVTFRKAIEGACERAGALAGGPVALVLPDPACRLALLPAVDLKVRRPQEAEAMIRFRLNKTVPFDVQQAHVAWAGPVAGQVLVAAIFQPVLDGYEATLRDLGFEPGVVEPASLAIMGTLERAAPAGDRLLVNWDAGYVSLVLTRAGWPVLIRTLGGTLAAEDVLREVGNTILYYRDRLGGQGLESAVVRSALLPSEEAVALLREPLGFEPSVLAPWLPLGEGDQGPATQSMAGAVSCLLRRAA